MGNGADTSLWEDVWRGGGAFKSIYPRIYALETCKNLTVAVKMSQENVGYSLHRIPRGGIEQVQFLEFLASMEGVALIDMSDRHVLTIEPNPITDAHYLLDHVMVPLTEGRARRFLVNGKRPHPQTSSSSSSTQDQEQIDPVGNYTLDLVDYCNQLPPIPG
ncbi:hypothetical protein Tco_0277977 [Tanacetum coccineum]